MPLVIKTTGFEDFLDPSGGAYLKALIMGDHGVGKTPSAACWPKPILADCENGRLSVASMAVPYADIKSSLDMAALLDMLRRECMKPAEKRQYQTLIVDTVDTYQRKLIQERLRAERKESLSGWADWGWLDGKMIALIESLLNLPMNVVVNMHTKDVSEEDGDESRLVQKARLKGDIKDAIFQDFDLIGHMEQSYVAGTGDKKGERVRVRQIRWHSEPKFPSLRDRSNKLPRFTDVTFTDQDYWQIFNAITSGLDDLPASRELETLEVEGDGAAPVAGPDEKGGPVEEPKVPAAKKTAAKKAPAKKAATAKKTATAVPTEDADQAPAGDAAAAGDASVATAVATSNPELVDQAPAAGDPWAPPATDVANPDADQAAVDLEPASSETEVGTDVPNSGDEKLEEAVQKVREELGGTVVEEEATPVKAVKGQHVTKEESAPARTAKHCGDQPESMVGKFDAVPGCGVELTSENAGKAQIAVMKFRTYLCNDDFAHRQAEAS